MVLATSRDIKRRMWCRPHMWKLHAFATLLTYSLNVRAASSIMPSVFRLSDTVMGQSTTVTVDGSAVLDNFCLVPKKQTFDLSGSRRRSFSQTSVEGRRCKTRCVGGRFLVVWRGSWHYHDHVNCHVTFGHVKVNIIMIISTSTWPVTWPQANRGILWIMSISFQSIRNWDFSRRYDNPQWCLFFMLVSCERVCVVITRTIL